MKYNPLVSIIIPIYNVAPYLKQCLDSVINQTYKNLDIVLVDDGSDDESLQICLDYAQKDDRIFVVSKINFHQGSARNVGLEFIKNSDLRNFCEGRITSIKSAEKINTFEKAYKKINKDKLDSFIEIKSKNFVKINVENINSIVIQDLPNRFIHFIDSDDYFELECIEYCIKNLNQAELIMHSYITYNEINKQITPKNKNITFKTYKSGINFLKKRSIYHYYLCWSYCFSTDILNKYNLRFTHGIHAEDDEFGIFLLSLANNVVFTSKELITYRIRENSTMTSENIEQFPIKLPKFLLPLKQYFTSYKELRSYFRSYSHLVIACNILCFIRETKDKTIKKILKRYFLNYIAGYALYHSTKKYLDVNELLKDNKININKLRIYLIFRSYFRHPLKIFKKKKA